MLHHFCDTMRVTFTPTLKTVWNIMNVQNCLITPMYTWRVTLHLNMHLTVVQAVIALGAYGLKCTAGKQIRVY